MNPLVERINRNVGKRDLVSYDSGPGGFSHLQVSSPLPLNRASTVAGMKQLARGKHRQLLEDEQIRRWYDNLCRGSKVTADVTAT